MAINAKPILLYDNRFNDGTLTATDTASGYDVLNIKDLRTYTFWKAASAGTKHITVYCGSSKSADALGIVGHNLFSANATVSVEYSATGAWAGEELVALAGFTPSDDKAFLKIFTSQSARYWRIKIVTASVAAYLAVLILGVKLTFERFLQAEFDPTPEKIESESKKSKTGNLLGSTVNFISRTIKASWKYLTPSWIDSTFKPAWDNHLSQLKPFFWAWDITNHSNEIFFVKISDDFSLSMPYDPIRRNLTLEMEGVKE